MENLKKAFDFYTGGIYLPPGLKWQKLNDRIEESDYTAYEFCYFCVHILTEEYNPAVLTRTNYVTSQDVWEQFLQYKRECKEQNIVYEKVCQHMNRLNNYIEIYGPEIINDPSIYVSAPVRCDRALKEGTDIDEKYSELADYIVKGNPEYLRYLKYLRRYYGRNKC